MKQKRSRIKIDVLMAASSVLGWVVALAFLTALQAESSGKTTAAYVQDITQALDSIDKNLSPEKPPHLDPASSGRRGVRLMDDTSPRTEASAPQRQGSEINGL